MTQFSDNLFLGSAPRGVPTEGPSQVSTGVGPLGRIYLYDIVPATISAVAVAAAQQLAGAGNFTLVAASGAGVTVKQNSRGETVVELDVPRNITFTSTADFSATTMTVRGYDVYGQPMTQTRAGPNNNTVGTLKAFKQILSISSSTALGTNTSIGFGDVFGLPFRVTDAGYLARVGWAGALAEDAGTFVAAVTTDPSTAALGDVRGTYAPSSASNGARRLVLGILLPAIASGPNATEVGAYGVTQV